MKPNRNGGGVYMPIAVVSGADRNIGLEIVKQFLQRGWKVFAGRYLMELPLLERRARLLSATSRPPRRTVEPTTAAGPPSSHWPGLAYR